MYRSFESQPHPGSKDRTLLAALVLEGHFDFCAVRLDLTVLELNIQLDDFGDP
jgi:hypothetical protein